MYNNYGNYMPYIWQHLNLSKTTKFQYNLNYNNLIYYRLHFYPNEFLYKNLMFLIFNFNY